MTYNRELVAERLEDLRKPEGRTISLKQLSKEIEEKTGIYISATQLNKYENPEKNDIMNVENLIAISDYYEVSYEYLLGKSDAKRKENVDIHERTGLSDDAIESLESLNNIISSSEIEGLVDDSERILKVINFILGDSHKGLQFLLDIGRYLFVDYGSEHHSEVKVIEDFIELIDKQTNRKQGFPVSIIKQSLLSEITFQLQGWEKNIRTSKEHK